jgi:hypothetical protein
MDEMEFTEAESNMNDLVAEYQQYQDATAGFYLRYTAKFAKISSNASRLDSCDSGRLGSFKGSRF